MKKALVPLLIFVMLFSSIFSCLPSNTVYAGTETALAWDTVVNSTNLQAIASNGSDKYVAAGFGSHKSSVDGINWTSHSFDTIPDAIYISKEYMDVIWDGNKFIQVASVYSNYTDSYHGTILTSNDGVKWNRNFHSTDQGLTSVAYNGANYLAVGGKSLDYDTWEYYLSVLKSNDGVNWTKTKVQYNSDLYGIVWGQNKFVAVGEAGSILTTTDGQTFVNKESYTNANLNAIVWTGQQYVAVGESGTVLTSVNGDSWISKSISNTSNLVSIAWNGNFMMAISSNGQVFTSNDAITWTEQNTGYNYYLNSVVWTGSRFLAAGRDGAILTSVDGSHWAQMSSSMYAMRGIWDGNRYVMVVQNNHRYDVAESTDGINWTLHATGYDCWLNDIAWNGSKYVAIGGDGAGGNLLTSTDLINWQMQESNPSVHSITWGGGRFVAVGAPHPDDAMNYNIVTSTDGINWSTYRTNGEYAAFNSVVYGNGKFVAVGYNGDIFTSTDGQSWTHQQTYDYTDLYSVAWNGSKFVAVGAAGLIQTSSDGINWSSRTLNEDYEDLNAVAAYGTNFITVARNGVTATSADGTNWTISPYKEGKSINAVVWNGSNFLATSAGNILKSRNIQLQSISGTVSLSANTQASSQDIWLSVIARSNSSGAEYSVNTKIPANNRSINYSINVAPDASGYTVYYSQNDSYQLGYYSTSGTSSELTSATPVIVLNAPVAGIDLTLAEADIQNIYFDEYELTMPIGASNTLQPVIYPISAAGKNIVWSSSNSSVAQVDQTGKVTAVALGTAVVRAESQADPSIYGTININVVAWDTDGNTFETAIPIQTIGTEIAGTIDPAGDVDYYKFTPATSGVYTIESKGNLDTFGYIYDSERAEIESDDDDGEGSNFLMEQYLTGGKTYYVKFKCYNSSQTGNYGLLIKNVTTIQGTISLPMGETAPAGGVEIQVTAEGNSYPSKYVTIPAGENSVAYVIPVTAGNYKIRYNVYNNNNYIDQGYYSETGTVTSYSSATQLTVSTSSIENINLTILKPKAIKGTVSLPAGETAPAGGLEVQLSGEGDNYAYKYVTIAAGTNSVSYEMPAVSGSYKIRYNIYSNTDKYISQGYYSSTGTVRNYSAATEVIVGESSVDNINLTIIKSNTIKGTVSLPAGETAPAGGLEILVSTEGDSYADNTVRIAAGASSAAYQLNVGPGNYKIKYYIYNSNGSYVQQGYYSETGTVANSNSATQLAINTESKENINLTVLKPKMIKGTVSLPAGDTAPAGGLSVQVTAEGDGYAYMNVTIAAGTNAAAYEIPVTAGVYRIRYYISNNTNNYINQGYYSSTGTVTSYSEAAQVTVGESSLDNINLTIIKSNMIKGTISLPIGETAPAGGMEVEINANGSTYTSKYITIAAGANSTTYEISVAPGSYKVRYIINNNTNSYVAQGYYSSAGTTASYSAATPVAVTTASVENINLTIIKSKMIKGTISLPAGETAPAGGLTVDINASGDSYVNKSVTIAAGTNSAIYEMPVASGKYKVRYHIYSSINNYVGQGYYSSTGTVADSDVATEITVGESSVDNINLIVIKGISIKGTISLPAGETAPVGGLQLTVSANGDSYAYKSLEITGGANSVAYELIVAPGIYRVSYYINGDGGNYVREGYYNNTGTVGSYTAASQITIGTASVENINLKILKGYSIKGTISLPIGETAPAGGLDVQISAEGDGDAYKSVKIPAGASSVAYEMIVSPGVYTVRYYINDTSGNYVESGYYNPAGTTGNYNLATQLTVSTASVENINITILKGYSIKGTISLPAGETAPTGGLEIRVYANGSNNVSEGYVIPAGANSVAYEMIVSPGSYKVRYYINNKSNTNVNNYVNEGYYSLAGTVSGSRKATRITVGSTSIDNINLTLIKGYLVKGTISLPIGETAPAGGLEVEMNASSDSYTYKWITIPEGANSATYEMIVASGQYRIYYYLEDSNNNYVNRGYYSVDGTKPGSRNSTQVVVGSTAVENINLTLMNGLPIQGTISLPNGATAPPEGLWVYINAQTEGYEHYDSINIPAGQNSVSYRLNVLPGSYKLLFEFDNRSSSYISGYYTGAGNLKNNINPETFTVAAPGLDNINVNAVVGQKVSGTISLPPGEVAPPDGMGVSVFAHGNGYANKYFSIEEGQSAIQYQLYMLPGDYRLEYHVYSENLGEYMSDFFYGETGNAANYDSASVITVGATAVSGINVNLSKSNISAAPHEGNIVVTNNVGTNDTIRIMGLSAGDIVKVYDLPVAGTVIGSATVAAGETSATIQAQLGVTAGAIYVSVTNPGKPESYRTRKDYTAEGAANAVTGVALDKASMELKIGENAVLIATITPTNAINKEVTWESSDAAVATVIGGTVTGVTAGTATITVRTVDGGFTASCVVTVKALGDTNGDKLVNIDDLVIMSLALGSTPTSANWDARADLNGDNVVDQKDLDILKGRFNK